MKLLTKAIEAKLLSTPVGSTDTPGRHPIIVRFFNPTGTGTWYIIEGEKLEDGDWRFFGLCEIHEAELGYVNLSELQSFRGRFNLGIERDLHFDHKFLDTSVTPAQVTSRGVETPSEKFFNAEVQS